MAIKKTKALVEITFSEELSYDVILTRLRNAVRNPLDARVLAYRPVAPLDASSARRIKSWVGLIEEED